MTNDTKDALTLVLALVSEREWCMFGREIRSPDNVAGCHCPITAAAAEATSSAYGTWQYLAAAEAVGMPRDTARIIADSSDTNDGYDPEVRAVLLACWRFRRDHRG